MQHPLGVLVQRIMAALEQLICDLHQQAFGILRLHICGHRAQHHGIAAKVRDLKARILPAEECYPAGPCFCLRSKVDGSRLQQHLAGHIAIVRG